MRQFGEFLEVLGSAPIGVDAGASPDPAIMPCGSKDRGSADVLEYLRLAMLTKADENGHNTTVVGIAGAGCLGKTTLSHRLRNLLGAGDCKVFSLDAYLLERQTRVERGGLTGYDPRSFELVKAAQDLEVLTRHGKSLVLRQYNRLTHRRDIPEVIRPGRILLVEGCLALCEPIRSCTEMRIFLDAGKTTQYVLRLQRERAEFGSTESEVLVRMKKYYADYLKHIKPQAAVADLILRVRPDYGLTIARRYFVRTERGSDLLIDV